MSKLQLTAITAIIPQAATGIRFHQAACVYPCEFSTPFIPETTRATTGVGCASAAGRKEIRSHILCTDCVGFRLLVILALVIPTNGHREAEADKEAEKS